MKTMDVPEIPKKGVIIGVVIILILAAGAYFLFFRNNGGSDGEGGDGDSINRSPVADAGRDITVEPGEIFYLNASLSSDPDDDPLNYYWDMDIGTDSNGDSIFDNDRNREGVNVSFSYPLTIEETTTFVVTLNVTEKRDDNPLWDRSTLNVRVEVRQEPLPPPEVEMSCSFIPPPFGLPRDPQFVLTVTSTTRDEFLSNYSYELEDPDANIIREGYLVDLINLTQNAEIRFFDTPALTYLDGSTDSFTLKENEDIIEGCVFFLIYNDILTGSVEAGYVELTK
jgi:hypothetical protein